MEFHIDCFSFFMVFGIYKKNKKILKIFSKKLDRKKTHGNKEKRVHPPSFSLDISIDTANYPRNPLLFLLCS